ncbi:MAG: 60S ribosomal export protein NMD3 [Gammaproteobacteria bacterium]|nr:60S ribosomal export protein NMD3 [Gammaproteobacteria bacterium]
MHCPSCKTTHLIPSLLEHNLPVFSCNICQGSFIEILSYRMWVDHSAPAEKKTAGMLLAVDDSKHAMVCPHCAKIMSKYQISEHTPNKIDLCRNCGRFWLDAGEWRLLQELGLYLEIPSIFNEPWQKAIRKTVSKKLREEKLLTLFGVADYQKIKEFKDWVKIHPKRAQIMDYLNNLSRD